MTDNRHRREEWHSEPPPPRSDGDEFTDARMIIDSGRLVLPADVTDRPGHTGNTQKDRAVLAAYLRRHGVPVPEFVPVVYGWLDCYTGQLANPAHESGADGRTHS